MTDAERTAWLEARRTGIGGSDVAAILGISPWTSRYKLWCDKRGLLPERENTQYQDAGNFLEAGVGEWYSRETGRLVKPGTGMQRVLDRPYMLANVDFIAFVPGQPPGILEIKTCDLFKGKEWLEEAPLHYQVQLQHYMAVTGFTWGSFAVLIGGNRFRWYDVERDDKFINDVLYPACAEFWRLVTEGIEPGIDDTESTNYALGMRYARDNGQSACLPMPVADELLAEYTSAQLAAKAAEARLTQAESMIRHLMGENTFGVVPGRGQWSLKAAKGKTRRTLRWSDTNNQESQ